MDFHSCFYGTIGQVKATLLYLIMDAAIDRDLEASLFYKPAWDDMVIFSGIKAALGEMVNWRRGDHEGVNWM